MLQAATPGGSWTGKGIVNAGTGEFSPGLAGWGKHPIIYNVTDGNGCSASDTSDIVVWPAPNGSITPVDPFCIYDAPYDLEAVTSLGSWTGAGITNESTGLFDPATAGPGRHPLRYQRRARRLGEPQQGPGVGLHRAGDVEQQHDAPGPLPHRRSSELQRLAAGPQRGPARGRRPARPARADVRRHVSGPRRAGSLLGVVCVGS